MKTAQKLKRLIQSETDQSESEKTELNQSESEKTESLRAKSEVKAALSNPLRRANLLRSIM